MHIHKHNIYQFLNPCAINASVLVRNKISLAVWKLSQLKYITFGSRFLKKYSFRTSHSAFKFKLAFIFYLKSLNVKQINIVTNEPIFYCSLTLFYMHKNKTIIQYNMNNKNWWKDSIIHVHRTNNKEMDNWEIKLSQKFQLIDPVSLTRIDTMFIYNKHDDSADNEECSHSEQYDICHVYTESSQGLLCVI